MRVVKIYCDRCGKEIEGIEEYGGVFGKLTGRDNTPDIEICLCEDCRAELKKFLEDKKNEKD